MELFKKPGKSCLLQESADSAHIINYYVSQKVKSYSHLSVIDVKHEFGDHFRS